MSTFWRFLTASTISNLGSGVSAVALPLIAILALDASNLQASVVTAAADVAWLLIGLPAGVLVSRWQLRRTQVSMDLIRATALASIPIAAIADVLTVTHLVVVAFVIGLCTVIFDVSNSTFVVTLVAQEELIRRNSQTSVSISAAQLGGPSLGGLLIQIIGVINSVIFDVLSYLVSATLISSLPSREQPTEKSANASFRAQIADGIHFVFSHPLLRTCTLNVTIINFAGGAMIALTPIFLVRTLHIEPIVIGLLVACEGVGTLVGAGLTTLVVARLGSARTLTVASFMFAITSFLMPLAMEGPTGAILFGLGNGLAAAGVAITSVLTRTHRQTVTPRVLLPRVMATVRFVSWGVIPVGAVLAGALATAVTPRTAFFAACTVGLLAPLQLLGGPVRHIVSLEDDPDLAGANA